MSLSVLTAAALLFYFTQTLAFKKAAYSWNVAAAHKLNAFNFAFTSQVSAVA
jgi:hypothetical protein